MKSISISRSVNASAQSEMFKEYKTMKMLDHHHVISLKAGYIYKDAFIMIMEFAEGGDLHDYVKKKGHLSEFQS